MTDITNTFYTKHKKKQSTYILLLIFAGYLGLHDLYLKKPDAAKTKIYFSIGLLLGILFPIASLVSYFALNFLLLVDLINSRKSINNYNESLYTILNSDYAHSDYKENIIPELFNCLSKKPEEYKEHFGLIGFFFGYDIYLEKIKNCIFKNLIHLVPLWLVSMFFHFTFIIFFIIIFGHLGDSAYWLLFFLPLTFAAPFLLIVPFYPIILIIFIVISNKSSSRAQRDMLTIIEEYNTNLHNEIFETFNDYTNTYNS